MGFGIVAALLPLLIRACSRWRITHRPEFHHAPGPEIPRIGGLGLVLALLANELVIAVFFPERRSDVPGRSTILLGSLAMFALGFWDDIRPLGARRKLAVQILISLSVWAGGVAIETLRIPFLPGVLHLGAWSPLVTCVWLVGLANLLNLSDGADGWAGGLAFMLLCLLLYLGCRSGAFVLMTSAMLGAVFAFLFFNWPPARVYLGDGGAYLLGFQIGLLSIAGSHKGSIVGGILAPLFVLALPLTDATLALLRRGLRGLPLFRPDRRHLHHRLLAMGLTSRQVLLWCYGVTLLFWALAFVLCDASEQALPLLSGLGLVVLLVCAGQWPFAREWFAVHRILNHSLAMRPEVSYGLSLANWLKQEGVRCGTLDELYSDLAFAAERLGFCFVLIRLNDGERRWGRPDGRCYSQAHGVAGTVEFRAPFCSGRAACPRFTGACRGKKSTACCRGDTRLFEILAELLAEAWAKAASAAAPGEQTLRFDTDLRSHETSRRRCRLPSDRPLQPNRSEVQPLDQSHDAAAIL